MDSKSRIGHQHLPKICAEHPPSRAASLSRSRLRRFDARFPGPSCLRCGIGHRIDRKGQFICEPRAFAFGELHGSLTHLLALVATPHREQLPEQAGAFYAPRSDAAKRLRAGDAPTTSGLVHNPPVTLSARDPIAGVEAGKHKLDARGPNRGVARRVHLKRLVPGWRHALQPIGVNVGR